MINEIKGDLIELANKGYFDVIVHGCNCQSTMKAGIAPQMAKAFGCDKYSLELQGPTITKLGNIDFQTFVKGENQRLLFVVNCYTQIRYGKNHPDGDVVPFDYEAFTICMRKINSLFFNKHIGMPKIGAGLGGGDWKRIKQIIEKTLIDCNVTIVIYDK